MSSDNSPSKRSKAEVIFANPWVGDFHSANVTNEQLKKFQPIASLRHLRFCSDPDNRVLAAPKGYGKTLFLEKKRAMLDVAPNAIVHPKDSPRRVEKLTSLGAVDTLQHDWRRHESRTDTNPLRPIWRYALGGFIVRLVRGDELQKICEGAQNVEESPAITQRTSWGAGVSKQQAEDFFDLFGRAISVGQSIEHVLDTYLNNVPKFKRLYNEIVLDTMQRLATPVYVFLDSPDEAFEKNSDKEDLTPIDQLGTLSPKLWTFFQLALLDLIREWLAYKNLHIYTTLRSEALQEVGDSRQQQAESLVTRLEYDVRDLELIFRQRIRMIPDSGLAKPEADDEIERFCGATEIPRIDGQPPEPIFQYLSRHTFMRPRDIIAMGEALAREREDSRGRSDPGKDPADAGKNPALFRLIVNRVAYRLFDNFRVQAIPNYDFIANDELLKLCESNLLSKPQMRIIAVAWEKKYLARLQQSNKHTPIDDDVATPSLKPWEYLYRAGLVGTISFEAGGEARIQRFRRPMHTTPHMPDTMPLADFYVLHPVLYSEYSHIKIRKDMVAGYELPAPTMRREKWVLLTKVGGKPSIRYGETKGITIEPRDKAMWSWFLMLHATASLQNQGTEIGVSELLASASALKLIHPSLNTAVAQAYNSLNTYLTGTTEQGHSITSAIKQFEPDCLFGDFFGKQRGVAKFNCIGLTPADVIIET